MVWFLCRRDNFFIILLFFGLLQADAIMAMAGSSGGSWSTNYSQNPSIKPFIGIGDNNTLSRERLNSTHGTGLSDRIPSIHGKSFIRSNVVVFLS